MWIINNDSFVSAVKDRNSDGLVVRARVRDDLVALFPDMEDSIIENSKSDYRFRVFVTKAEFAEVIVDRINDIHYDNFKDSVFEKWRKEAYTRIWSVMYAVQAKMYGDQYDDDWTNYRRYR